LWLALLAKFNPNSQEVHLQLFRSHDLHLISIVDLTSHDLHLMSMVDLTSADLVIGWSPSPSSRAVTTRDIIEFYVRKHLPRGNTHVQNFGWPNHPIGHRITVLGKFVKLKRIGDTDWQARSVRGNVQFAG
jgi:hypothetical protein